MAIQITNKQNTIEIYYEGNGDRVSIDKDKLTLEKEGDYLIFRDGGDDPKEFRILFSEVSSPSVASADELFTSVDGFSNTIQGGAVSSAIVTQALTETSVKVLSAGDAAVGASMINLSDQDAYILLGSGTASATNHTVKLPSGGSAIYEMPYNYSGEVNLVFAGSGTGNLLITKFS